MFDEEQLNEFINRMFDNGVNTNSDVKIGLATFRKYLKETSMCTTEYLVVLDKIIECSSELLALKKKIKGINIVSFVEDALNNESKIKPVKQKTVGVKQNHTVVSSSSCMGSAINNRCGSSYPSYSNSCGGSSGYSSRC